MSVLCGVSLKNKNEKNYMTSQEEGGLIHFLLWKKKKKNTLITFI